MPLSGGLSHFKTLALLFLDISYFENSVVTDKVHVALADQDPDTVLQANNIYIYESVKIQCKQRTATEVYVA